MSSKKSRLLLLLTSCFITATAMAQRYTVTDLGSLSPTGINSLAQVVGNNNNQAYIWNGGRMHPLGLLPGGTVSQAAGINDFGVVTGTANGAGTVIDSLNGNQQCSNLVQPFIWKNGQLRGLGTTTSPAEPSWMDCDLPYIAAAINNQGYVVGTMPEGPSTYSWGFLWTGATGLSLYGGGWTPSFITGINNHGQIVGQDSVYLDTYAAWWQSANVIGNGLANLPAPGTDLGALINPLDNAAISMASGVNDAGQIVGWSAAEPGASIDACYYQLDAANCIIHAVEWTPNGVISDLGTLPGDELSIALKINSTGAIIGVSGNTLTYTQSLQVTGRPFIWTQANGMQDLNTLIPSRYGWVLNTATDINVWGQIVGEGTRNGQPHGYLLTPKNPFQVF